MRRSGAHDFQGYPRTPAPARPNKRPRWMVGGATILTFVALLYLVELIDQLTNHSLEGRLTASAALRRPTASGVIIFALAELLHANWAHLIANTIPLLVLGFLMTLAGISRFVWATAIIWILGGFGTWLIGNMGGSPAAPDRPHRGVRLDLRLARPSCSCSGCLSATRVAHHHRRGGELFLYGGVLLGAMPVLDQCGGVSWRGSSRSGAVAGVVAAYLLSAPERKGPRV